MILKLEHANSIAFFPGFFLVAAAVRRLAAGAAAPSPWRRAETRRRAGHAPRAPEKNFPPSRGDFRWSPARRPSATRHRAAARTSAMARIMDLVTSVARGRPDQSDPRLGASDRPSGRSTVADTRGRAEPLALAAVDGPRPDVRRRTSRPPDGRSTGGPSGSAIDCLLPRARSWGIISEQNHRTVGRRGEKGSVVR